MKRFCVMLLCILLLCAAAGAESTELLIMQTPNDVGYALPAEEAESGVQRREVTFAGQWDRTFRAWTDAVTLDLGYVVVEDWSAFMAFLDQLPQLTRVDMYATEIDREHILQLAERYPQIDFGWTMKIPCWHGYNHLVRTDATAFSTLHGSTQGIAAGHTEEELDVLKYCRNLKALDLGHNKIQDLSFISGLTGLRVLIIACNEITDLSPLAGLTEMEYAELFNNFITDISPLTGWHHILDLNLSYNDIEDFSPLFGLTTLKRLWLNTSGGRDNHAKVPEEIISMIRGGNPSVRICNEPGDATSWGWRDHKHYYVIYRVFNSQRYEPFEDSWPEQ